MLHRLMLVYGEGGMGGEEGRERESLIMAFDGGRESWGVSSRNALS